LAGISSPFVFDPGLPDEDFPPEQEIINDADNITRNILFMLIFEIKR